MFKVKNLFKTVPFITRLSINELEKSSLLLEKQYSELKEKDEQNKKLYNQLKKININLKKELKKKKEELDSFYTQTTFTEKSNYLQEVQTIEREIAGGFAHKLKNLYDPVILLSKSIQDNNILAHNKKNLLEVFNLLHNRLTKKKLSEIIPHIENINDSHKKINKIFSISNDVIQRNISLINNFLNYTNIERSNSEVHCKTLIDKVIQSNNAMFLKYEIKVSTDIKYQKYIMGDFEQFFILLQNLIINAVKAVNKKKVSNYKKRISIKTYISSNNKKNKKFVCIEVSDNGIGISKEDISKIFTLFFTGEKNNGTGMGLSLCKRIVELYKGDISVYSQKGKGATFKIAFPLGEE